MVELLEPDDREGDRELRIERPRPPKERPEKELK